jgi:DNA (cytosine-5)-methyltransferase 1
MGWTSSVDNFLTNTLEDIMVDILHFSPPCQTFSSAHTISSANDDANEACIFSTRELLARVKPRIATMEETSGLKDRHKEFLYATIHNFVDLGYSIRWKLLSCQDFGVPQKRKRLVIIGSG